MKKFASKKLILIHSLGFIVLLFFINFTTLYADTAALGYTPMTDVPWFSGNVTSLTDLINRLYIYLIAIGSAFGILKIAFAGVKYTTSDVVSSKQSAKDDIRGVFLGLAILFIPFIVLNTIHPGLTELNFIDKITKVDTGATSGRGVPRVGEGILTCQKTQAISRESSRDKASFCYTQLSTCLAPVEEGGLGGRFDYAGNGDFVCLYSLQRAAETRDDCNVLSSGGQVGMTIVVDDTTAVGACISECGGRTGGVATYNEETGQVICEFIIDQFTLTKTVFANRSELDAYIQRYSSNIVDSGLLVGQLGGVGQTEFIQKCTEILPSSSPNAVKVGRESSACFGARVDGATGNIVQFPVCPVLCVKP